MGWHDVVFYTAGGPVVIACKSEEEAREVWMTPDDDGLIYFTGVKLRMGEGIIEAKEFSINMNRVTAVALVKLP